MWVYRVLAAFLRVAARVFFRQVEVVGQELLPTDENASIIFAGNHPNSLVDPILVVAFSGRIVHFAAKDTLFQSRLLRFFLRGLGAVPVMRKSDHGDAASNDSAFAALENVLAEGRCMGIFPEGISYDASSLQKLKTGAARIALNACRNRPQLTVYIVPCGLTYIRKRRFRSRALLQFGPPILVRGSETADDSKELFEEAKTLTTRLETAIRALTINADDWETLRVLDGVRRIYQPPAISIEERIELARRFSANFPFVKDKPNVIELFERVREYLDRLAAMGLRDRDILVEPSNSRVEFRLLRHVALLVVWLPLALPGLVLHAPIGLLAIFAGRFLTPRKDVIATTKLVAGLAGTLLLHLLLIVGAGWKWGGLGAVGVFLMLPLTGWATLQVFDRLTHIRRWFGTFRALLRFPEQRRELMEERKALEQKVLEIVDQYRPKDLTLLFPRSRDDDAKKL
ncbi:MAG: 1-acyl-sn-glycerol-3-phosphate acyltransferase [Myxococcales bacterium]|nr:1-acyl-sn-glycerol-3-phosphate acyltransferase [Myxococcales bacterium]